VCVCVCAEDSTTQSTKRGNKQHVTQSGTRQTCPMKLLSTHGALIWLWFKAMWILSDISLWHKRSLFYVFCFVCTNSVVHEHALGWLFFGQQSTEKSFAWNIESSELDCFSFKSCKMLYLCMLNITSDIEVKYMVCYTRELKSKMCPKCAVLETSPKFSGPKPLSLCSASLFQSQTWQMLTYFNMICESFKPFNYLIPNT